MEYQNKDSSIKGYKKSKNLSLIGVISILILIGISIYGGFLIYKNRITTQQIEATKTAIQEQKNIIKISDNQNVDLKFKNNFLAQKRKEQIFWSNVINNLKTYVSENDRIDINSIAGNITGNVNVNLATNENSIEPFTDTAKLITRLKATSFAQNVFIPSINKITTLTGENKLTYTLRFDYNKSENESLNTILETQTTNPATNQKLIEELQRRSQTPPTAETSTTNQTE